jgi:copper transport protein
MADTSAMTAAAPATSGWTYAVGVNRWVLYAAMLLAAGSALFVLLLNAAPAVNRVAFETGGLAAWLAIAAYLLSVGFGGAEMLLGSAGALFSAEAWSRGLGSTLAPSAAIGVPAMLLLIWAFRRSADAPRAGALGLGAALGVASFLVTGHAATASPVWLLATTVAIHLACTSFWLGSLRPLWRSTELVPLQQSGALLTQFSTLAVWAVGAIVVTGLVISWTQVQSIESLFGNPYGTALQRKLLLFVVLLGLAAYNKFSLTPALERGAAAAAPKIRRTIRIEFFVYLLILVAAMLMTVTTPPRSIAPASAAGAAVMGAAGPASGIKTSATASGYVVDIELSSDRAGENMLMATVKDAEGKVLENMADLEIVLGLPAAGIQDVRIKAEKMPDGMWHAMIAEMIIPGEWQVGVEAFVTDYDKVEFASTVQIR